MQHTRSASAVALLAVTGLVASGCAAGDTDAAGPVELTVWTGFTGGDAVGYDQIVEDFNASQDRIHVTMSAESWDTIQQKLPSAWLTGEGPDIAAPSSDPNVIAQYVENGSVLPITATGDGEDEINVDDFAQALVDEFTYDGELYAVPANYATLSLYYNKSLFEDAGIAPPTTLDELKDAAVQLTDGDIYGLALADNNTIQMWPVLQWLEGGDIVDADECSVLDDPDVQDGLREWVDLVIDEGISPVGLSGAEADDLFAAGKAAMEINGPWAAAGFEEAGVDVGIIALPASVTGESVTLGSTVPLAISAKTPASRRGAGVPGLLDERVDAEEVLARHRLPLATHGPRGRSGAGRR